MRLRWSVRATTKEIAFLSDDVDARGRFTNAERLNAVRVVRTEQALFGALVGANTIIRDTATVTGPVMLPADAIVHDVDDVDAAVNFASVLLSESQHVGADPVVAVMNALGGSGASTLAWLIAAHYAATGTTVLIDADDRSPGLDLWTCHERAAAVRWTELHDVTSDVHPSRLWDCLIHVSPTLRLLSQGRTPMDPSAAASAIILSALESHTAVVDLSSTRSSQLRSAVLQRANLIIIVSAASVSGCAAAQGALARLTQECASTSGRITCALRAPRFGVSMSAARSAISVPVVAVPEDVRMLGALRERKLKSLVTRRWNSVVQVLPESPAHSGYLSTPADEATPAARRDGTNSESFRISHKATRLLMPTISRVRAFMAGR